MTDTHAHIRQLAEIAPIIPVLVVDNLAHAEPLARALVAGGLPVLEVTLRTACALDVITAMSRVEGAYVGAGTLVTPDDVTAAVAAGATFGVSPGAPDDLLDACAGGKGYDILKFFPAEGAGGITTLKGLGGPLPGISFCPTGGVSPQNAQAYLSLPNVVCAGGSWIAPADLVTAQKWDEIEARARAASKLRA